MCDDLSLAVAAPQHPGVLSPYTHEETGRYYWESPGSEDTTWEARVPHAAVDDPI